MNVTYENCLFQDDCTLQEIQRKCTGVFLQNLSNTDMGLDDEAYLQIYVPRAWYSTFPLLHMKLKTLFFS